jgi:chromosome partitioning protein
MVKARKGIDIVTSEVDLAAAESELATHTERHNLLYSKLQPVVNKYDFIMIDCPPSLGLLTINALAASRELIVPMQAHFLALQGISRLFETVLMLVRGMNPNLRVTGVVLCMHEAHTNLAKEVVSDLKDFFEASRDQDVPWRNCILLDPPIRRNVKLAEAPSFGQTIFDYEPKCAGANDYRKLVESVLEANPANHLMEEVEIKIAGEPSEPVINDIS